MRFSIQQELERVNKELWLVFSLFVIAGLLNFLVSSQRMVLAFYTLPTVFSAYLYGRRHATLTALASVLLVVLLGRANPLMFTVYSLLMIVLGENVWAGYPGAATRVLLPMTFAFNVLLPRSAWFWPLFVLGNLTVLQGLETLRVPFLWQFL